MLKQIKVNAAIETVGEGLERSGERRRRAASAGRGLLEKAEWFERLRLAHSTRFDRKLRQTQSRHGERRATMRADTHREFSKLHAYRRDEDRLLNDIE